MITSNAAVPTSTITRKGQITVPLEVRKALDVRPGEKVGFIQEEGGSVRLIPVASAITANFGALADRTPSGDFKSWRDDFEEGVAEEAASKIL